MSEKALEFKQMEGHTYRVGKDRYAIASITHIVGDKYRLVTDKGDLLMTQEQILTDMVRVSEAIVVQSAQTHVLEMGGKIGSLDDLSDGLMDAFRKVQNDANYINQAKALSETARQIIDLRKTQIEMVKVIRDMQ